MPITPRKKNNNRASLAFLGGLAFAATMAISSDGWGRFMAQTSGVSVSYGGAREVKPGRALSPTEWNSAATAWSYFEVHYRPATGMVDSVSGFSSGTLWDQGSYLFALMSAKGLSLIDEAVFVERTEALLSGLERLELFDELLPNKVYDTQSLQMVDYGNAAAETGVGWSALDITRMLMALRILEIRQPDFGPRIRRLLSTWSLNAMTNDGRLLGASVRNGVTQFTQEGRIGYEQYGARAAALWGLDVLDATSARTIMDWHVVSEVEVPIDRRLFETFGAITPTLSEPYFLQALELGLNAEAAELASRIYAAQEARFHLTGQLTMVSEDHIDQAPHFLYSSVYSNGEPWAVLTETGEIFDGLRTVSLKAAFAWDALYDTSYTDAVLETLSDLATPNGWAAGRYEADGQPNSVVTLNTNAVVLEALHFVHKGPLVQAN